MENKQPKVRRKVALEADLAGEEEDPTIGESAEMRPIVEEAQRVDLSEEGTRVPYEEVDAYTLYLREIGKTKLLTPADEVVLAKRIQKGDETAREAMIKANLRLVVKIARDYEGLACHCST